MFHWKCFTWCEGALNNDKLAVHVQQFLHCENFCTNNFFLQVTGALPTATFLNIGYHNWCVNLNVEKFAKTTIVQFLLVKPLECGQTMSSNWITTITCRPLCRHRFMTLSFHLKMSVSLVHSAKEMWALPIQTIKQCVNKNGPLNEPPNRIMSSL